MPGFVSFRNEIFGSFYIQALCKHLDSVTPGSPIKNVFDAHFRATEEVRKMRINTNDFQTPSISLATVEKAIGFLPTSDGKEKIRCFFKKDDAKYKDLVDYLNYVESTGAAVEYCDPPHAEPVNNQYIVRFLSGLLPLFVFIIIGLF